MIDPTEPPRQPGAGPRRTLRSLAEVDRAPHNASHGVHAEGAPEVVLDTYEQAAMIFHAESFVIRTSGRGTTEITDRVEAITAASRASSGLCSVFIHHTSASLILCENADPSVRRDLERFAQRLVPDGDRLFEHDDEGPDDMPAHVRSILTTSTLTIPIAAGSLALGTWQGIYLWEHRTRPHSRKLTVSVVGIG